MFKRKIALACLYCLSISTLSFANSEYNSKEEGRLTIKLRLGGTIPKTTYKGIEVPENKKVLKPGIVGEAASIIFFNDRWATELFVGVNVFKFNKKFIKNIKNYSSDAKENVSTKGNLFMVPLGFNLQYHIAPFGAIRPYIGGGYCVGFLFSSNKNFSKNMKNNYSHGAVTQIGVDFVYKDDTTIGIDVKKYWLSPKLKYKTIIEDNSKSKLKLSPVAITLSLGYNF